MDKIQEIGGAVVAVLVTGGVVALAVTGKPIPDVLGIGFGVVTGFFFGNVSGAVRGLLAKK